MSIYIHNTPDVDSDSYGWTITNCKCFTYVFKIQSYTDAYLHILICLHIVLKI